MAFTIDFGNDESEEKKKLSLRDGIRRFAPNKKTPREKASNADSVTSTSPSPVAAVVVRLPTNSNNFVDRKVEPSTELRTSKRVVVVDRENNIQPDVVLMSRNDDARDAKACDAASEAGTYTIDQVGEVTKWDDCSKCWALLI